MLSPKFGQEYSRKDIHSIFSPETPFYPGSGTWGNHGVIPIPDTQKSYVFIASYHSKQGEHVFQEGITRDGILTWQSQPHQSLTEKRVQHWVNHDNDTDDIHFFLRPSKNGPYTYLGRLAYISHDPVKERPVYFQFKLLDWEPSLVSEALYGPEPTKLKALHNRVTSKIEKKFEANSSALDDYADSTANHVRDLITLNPQIIDAEEGYRFDYNYEVTPFNHPGSSFDYIIPLVGHGPGRKVKIVVASIGERDDEVYRSCVKLKLFQSLIAFEKDDDEASEFIQPYLLIDREIGSVAKKFCDKYSVHVLKV